MNVIVTYTLMKTFLSTKLNTSHYLTITILIGNIIPHIILSFFMLYNGSGRYITIFCVISITPAAPVVICTKYGLGKWHSTFF